MSLPPAVLQRASLRTLSATQIRVMAVCRRDTAVDDSATHASTSPGEAVPNRCGPPLPFPRLSSAIAQRAVSKSVMDECRFAPSIRVAQSRVQIDSPTSPSRTDVFSRGRSPLFHSAAVCATRYLIGPPSGLSLRAMGRGMQTNSVRISSADNWTLA